MTKKENSKHYKCLQRLEHHLNLIDEDSKLVRSVLIEPHWYRRNKCEEISLCDMIIMYDYFVVPVEVKCSLAKRDKALQQIWNGLHYAKEILGYKAPYGKFVTYNKRINYEKIQLEIKKR